jgi:hypothetical protein
VQPPNRTPLFAVLHDVDFRTLWYVGGLSEIARWMEQLILSLLIWHMTRSDHWFETLQEEIQAIRDFFCYLAGRKDDIRQLCAIKTPESLVALL